MPCTWSAVTLFPSIPGPSLHLLSSSNTCTLPAAIYSHYCPFVSTKALGSTSCEIDEPAFVISMLVPLFLSFHWSLPSSSAHSQAYVSSLFDFVSCHVFPSQICWFATSLFLVFAATALQFLVVFCVSLRLVIYIPLLPHGLLWFRNWIDSSSQMSHCNIQVHSELHASFQASTPQPRTRMGATSKRSIKTHRVTQNKAGIRLSLLIVWHRQRTDTDSLILALALSPFFV